MKKVGDGNGGSLHQVQVACDALGRRGIVISFVIHRYSSVTLTLLTCKAPVHLNLLLAEIRMI